MKPPKDLETLKNSENAFLRSAAEYMENNPDGFVDAPDFGYNKATIDRAVEILSDLGYRAMIGTEQDGTIHHIHISWRRMK